MQLAFSVDLEPNKDGSFEGVQEAMVWFDSVIPRGTVFATYRVATELPGVLEQVAANHEIGVHVHPREFGHENDQLAELPPERQRELIAETHDALEPFVDGPIRSFRAGRHSASFETFDVLADLGFEVDASVHVRYRDYLPERVTAKTAPFTLDNGLFEVPTTYVRPRLLSRVGLRVFPQRTVTATSATLRADSPGCSGVRAIRSILDRSDVVSMYMHPYDATAYESELAGNGEPFRRRVEQTLPDDQAAFVSVSDLAAVTETTIENPSGSDTTA